MPIYYAETLDRTFHALGDASRRRMLAAIASEGAATAGDLGALLKSAQPTVSRHLKVLEQAGLVERRIEGRHHVFKLAPARMREAKNWLEDHLAFWEESLDAFDALLEEMKSIDKESKK